MRAYKFHLLEAISKLIKDGKMSQAETLSLIRPSSVYITGAHSTNGYITVEDDGIYLDKGIKLDSTDMVGRCSVCGNVYVKDRDVYTTQCPVCRETMASVNSYDYTPSEFKFRGKGVYFGLELEANFDRGMYDEIIKAVIARELTTDYSYVVHDGSIESGIEVVVQPMTYEYMQESNVISELIGKINSFNGTCNHYTCGGHIHMDKAGITQRQQYLMMMFVANNKDKLLDLSMREDADKIDRYCSFNLDKRTILKSIDRGVHTGKYYAIADRGKTLEFRLFGGTDNVSLIYARIEFILALRELAGTIQGSHITWSEYTDYVMNTNYNGIKNELRRLNLCA